MAFAIDMTQIFYIVYAVMFFLLFTIVVAGKWVLFGMKMFLATIRFKRHNIGLVFIRGLGNGFGFPLIVDLRKNSREDKKETRYFTREMFKEGTWFGYPYLLTDSNDMKTSYGLYKHQCDETGTELFYQAQVFVGLDQDTKKELYKPMKIPILDAVKTSVSIPPDLLKTAYAYAAMSQALQDFIKKNQMLLIICGLTLLAAGVGAYFSYTNQDSLAHLCVTNFGELSKQVLVSIGTNTTVIH